MRYEQSIKLVCEFRTKRDATKWRKDRLDEDYVVLSPEKLTGGGWVCRASRNETIVECDPITDVIIAAQAAE